MEKNLSKKIIEHLLKYYGYVKPDLRYKNLFQITIAVVLSAQTTDRQVNSVTPVLFNRYPDFFKLSQADIADIEVIVKSTGFYKNKAGNIVNLSKKIVQLYNGKLPNRFEELITLPGIGRKSANVILSNGFKIPALAVDTHVIRIANRLGYINSTNPLHIEKALTSIIPEKNWIMTHLLFIKHGRKICKARNPFCSKCPINNLCVSVNNIFCNP